MATEILVAESGFGSCSVGLDDTVLHKETRHMSSTIYGRASAANCSAAIFLDSVFLVTNGASETESCVVLKIVEICRSMCSFSDTHVVRFRENWTLKKHPLGVLTAHYKYGILSAVPIYNNCSLVLTATSRTDKQRFI